MGGKEKGNTNAQYVPIMGPLFAIRMRNERVWKQRRKQKKIAFTIRRLVVALRRGKKERRNVTGGHGSIDSYQSSH